jgi:hypothetical protein
MVLVVIDDGKTFVLLKGHKNTKPHLCHAEDHHVKPLQAWFGAWTNGSTVKKAEARAIKRAKTFGCTGKSEMVDRAAQLCAVVYRVVGAIHGEVVAARVLTSRQASFAAEQLFKSSWDDLARWWEDREDRVGSRVDITGTMWETRREGLAHRVSVKDFLAPGLLKNGEQIKSDLDGV